MSTLYVVGRFALAGFIASVAPVSPAGEQQNSYSAKEIAVVQVPAALVLADSLDRAIHRANMSADPQAMVQLRSFAQRALIRYPDHPLLVLHLAQTYYREAYLRLGTDKAAGQALLKEAQALLEKAARRSDAPAETHAMLSAVIGMRITNPLRGMTMGRRSDAAMEHAVRSGPENPRVWLMRGIGTLHKPAIAGGGVVPALEQLQRAETLFREEQRSNGAPGWGRAEGYAWLGVAYKRANRPQDARRAWMTALEIEPEYVWVRSILLPSL